MSLSNKRIQDPVLTQLAQGYHNNELVSDTLMPVVEIGKEAGKIPQFGRLAFRVRSTVRELHGASNRLSPEDVGVLSIELKEHDAEYPIDYREDYEANYPLKQYATSVIQDVIALGREVKIAEITQNPDNYDEENVIRLTDENRFTNAKSNPLKIIDDGLNIVTSTIGRRPNTCVIASDVWSALKENKELLERIKYTRTGILTPQIFAELIGVNIVKIGAATQEKDGQLIKVWTNSVILAYIPENSRQGQGSIFEPSYGYTVRRKAGLFVDSYTEKGGKIEIIRCTDIHEPCLVGKSAGYLITNCIK
ncbi:inorganic pyrophosphatase [Pasteurella atlantica]|uniref:inorganic pyrophosphatase n=1 Tax=Pasteurellaceae TaxID=712 RepID=UPI0027531B8E|nr:inorganic pyrophosphatase [Pasteurella atlantica]MDP8100092.1 inorganic pyrophosphatase [Pasteurella atlantica]MDP8108007.1 inorganic pyrophosphatase [Pasteurella atlantica]MDP8117731.1 inorganic pyrophosphatase [Pasteurella atlantica]